MPVYFFDSSALVKRYQFEAGSERVSNLVDEAELLLIARLTQVEVTAAIVRRGRATRTPEQEVDRLLAAFERDVLSSLDVVEFSSALLDESMALTRRHGLRAADAIQLAAAALARPEYAPSNMIFVASDRELNAAAMAEGFSILDPTVP
jgi:predicted nucleic acid-binding protein